MKSPPCACVTVTVSPDVLSPPACPSQPWQKGTLAPRAWLKSRHFSCPAFPLEPQEAVIQQNAPHSFPRSRRQQYPVSEWDTGACPANREFSPGYNDHMQRRRSPWWSLLSSGGGRSYIWFWELLHVHDVLIPHQVHCLQHVTCASQTQFVPQDAREEPNDSGELCSCI